MARRKSRRTSHPAPAGRRIRQLTTEDHLAVAKEFRLAGDQDPEERAQNYCEAAETYAMAGDPVTAEELFRAAMDDGGEVAGGVHGYFASFLFQQDRPDEALAVIEAARKLRPDDSDPFVFEIIAEVLATHGHPREAAAWATRGLVALYGSLADITADDLEEEPDGVVLAAIRRQARQAADLPADNVDDLAAADLDALMD
jgi:Tfp pilus assembly protein PilF